MDAEQKLVRRLAAISEASQRVAVLCEEVERLGAEAFVQLFAGIAARAAAVRSARDQLALAALIDYLASDLVSDDLRLALLTAARDGQHHDLMSLLAEPRPHRVEDEQRVPDYGAGRLVTLGERKSLARTNDRRILEKVMADPHPAVIRNLLGNPKLTEQDVLRIVTRRPSREEVLTEVYRNKRWSSRYRIKLALVYNPYTPPALALKLLPLLLRQDLAEIGADEELHPSVVMACRRLLKGERPRDEADGEHGVGEPLGDERDDDEVGGDEPGPLLH